MPDATLPPIAPLCSRSTITSLKRRKLDLSATEEVPSAAPEASTPQPLSFIASECSGTDRGEDDEVDEVDQAGPAVGEQPLQATEEDNWQEFALADDSPTHSGTEPAHCDSAAPLTNVWGPKIVGIDKPIVTPGAALDLLMDGAILDRFVATTNRYAQATEVGGWKDLDISELKKYWSIVAYCGVCERPEMNDYWKEDLFRYNFVPSVMTRDRFKQITSTLRWEDTAALTPAERAGKNEHDSFWTVSGFIDQLAANFQRHFECGRCITVDEMCIFFKGRHRSRCYNPHKPNKWHFKAYCLNDSTTGYLHNMFMYQGRDEKRPEGQSSSSYPVPKLTELKAYHGQGHIISMDNWFTSIDPISELQKCPRSMHCIGTIRAHRTGIPKRAILKSTQPRGTIVCQKHKKEALYFQ